MIDGILLIDKEKGITSYDVIRKLKKILPKGQKIGHAGTLDPFATGLLIILLGRGTKLMEDILQLEKGYIVKAEFGYATDTQDITGKKVLEDNKGLVVPKYSLEEIIKKNFLGEIRQVPPSYSAIKIKGKKAYEYARDGKEVQINSRAINISEFSCLDYNWPFVTFKILCSSGTYVRTLINDLGIQSGAYATAVELRRFKIGNYLSERAFKSEEISEGNIDRILNSIINLNNK